MIGRSVRSVAEILHKILIEAPEIGAFQIMLFVKLIYNFFEVLNRNDLPRRTEEVRLNVPERMLPVHPSHKKHQSFVKEYRLLRQLLRILEADEILPLHSHRENFDSPQAGD